MVPIGTVLTNSRYNVYFKFIVKINNRPVRDSIQVETGNKTKTVPSGTK
jgi:hypothetical protein